MLDPFPSVPRIFSLLLQIFFIKGQLPVVFGSSMPKRPLTSPFFVCFKLQEAKWPVGLFPSFNSSFTMLGFQQSGKTNGLPSCLVIVSLHTGKDNIQLCVIPCILSTSYSCKVIPSLSTLHIWQATALKVCGILFTITLLIQRKIPHHKKNHVSRDF